MLKFFLVKFIAFFIGCLLCFVLHTVFNIPAVIAASSVGLAGSFIPFSQLFKNHPSAAIYAGSFAGMCSSSLISSYWELGFISLIGACLASKNVSKAPQNAMAGYSIVIKKNL